MSRSNRTSLFAASLCAALAAPATADTANFDSFKEGFTVTVLTDGGITFTNLTRRIDGDPIPAPFTIEDASADLSGMKGFTPPNTLNFGGFSPGPGTGFSRLGAFDITPEEPSNSVRLEVFNFGSNDPGTTVNLEAFLNGASVALDTVPAATNFALHHYTLGISGVDFDQLRLFIGPTENDVIFAVVDTVVIEVGGEPCTADYNEDGEVNSNDFFAFLDDFFEGDDRADINEDGTVNSNDVFAFLDAFFEGC